MHIALVTARHVDPDLTDDVYLSEALTECGQRFDWRAWDDPAVRWQDYDRVVLRSCWGYHLDTPRFEAWLMRLDVLGVHLINPSSLVRGNIHKRYLLELAAAGVPIPKLRLVPQGSTATLESLQREMDSAELIVKPAVSGCSWRTFRVPAGSTERWEAELAVLTAERDVLVQAFVPEIQTLGEYSLIFIAGRYSHAILKTPVAGEFRCQPEYGGRIAATIPPDSVFRAAERASLFTGDPTYARVDIVESAGTPMIMEVELIEPVLFFRQAPEAARRLAQALCA